MSCRARVSCQARDAAGSCWSRDPTDPTGTHFCRFPSGEPVDRSRPTLRRPLDRPLPAAHQVLDRRRCRLWPEGRTSPDLRRPGCRPRALRTWCRPATTRRTTSGGTLDTLEVLGVRVDFEADGYQADPIQRHRFAEAVQEITEHKGKRRHHVPADHDGELLNVVSHLRRKASAARESPGIWPGAFIVTTDKSLTDVYRRVAADDAPVALTISQAASLLARLTQPADAEKLAEVIAMDLQWQARFQRATAFGVDQAIELARSFTAQDPDALIVEASSAELTFEDVLCSVDYEGDPSQAARAAILQQGRRRRNAADSHRSALEAERVKDRERAVRAEAEAKTLRSLAEGQADQLATSAHRESDQQVHNEELINKNLRLKRSILVIVTTRSLLSS